MNKPEEEDPRSTSSWFEKTRETVGDYLGDAKFVAQLTGQWVTAVGLVVSTNITTIIWSKWMIYSYRNFWKCGKSYKFKSAEGFGSGVGRTPGYFQVWKMNAEEILRDSVDNTSMPKLFANVPNTSSFLLLDFKEQDIHMGTPGNFVRAYELTVLVNGIKGRVTIRPESYPLFERVE